MLEGGKNEQKAGRKLKCNLLKKNKFITNLGAHRILSLISVYLDPPSSAQKQRKKICKNLPHILLCISDCQEHKLNSNYTCAHFYQQGKLFSEAPKQLLTFSSRITLYHMHRPTIWKGGRNHCDQPKDDSQHSRSFLKYKVIHLVVTGNGGHHWHLANAS